MRVNAKTLLEGRHVVLVPYEREHVPRYHMWMQSAELQKLTASEPLSLEQEFAMQRSWREDPDKCTFIVLERAAWDREPCSEETCMAGDVNLFLTDPGDHSLAEVEIMIAEPSCRGKGLGREATLIMMQYGLQNLGIKTYQAKIGMDNVVSISMFKKMHFKEVSRSNVFQEVTLQLAMDVDNSAWLTEQTAHVIQRDYAQPKCCED
ncbi:alpha/beta-tubulin-N-acetyltransferase 9 isoform X5 [Petromyzon marinus]|uniref:Alpha/beta-tubulin-N-acetyltransferase 9 n=2 Tax=Petromyzon marinus TaxID=7757 RepID=A0AAJ7TRU8_PETMA|nr:N-acetyltransferase 9 isoform X5 [Petromyzon marinus]